MEVEDNFPYRDARLRIVEVWKESILIVRSFYLVVRHRNCSSQHSRKALEQFPICVSSFSLQGHDIDLKIPSQAQIQAGQKMDGEQL